MTVVVIAYPPSGGGNHLKNILCLDSSFANSSDLDKNNYFSGEREVHSTPGRNMFQQRVEQASVATQDYILHGHFGELAPWRNEINAIQDKKWLVINIDTARDRYLLNIRQSRLGQRAHEYYLNEEQPYLYQTEFYQSYFTGQAENIYTIALNDFWNPEFEQSQIIQQLNVFLNKNIDQAQAQNLHRHWHINNDINYY
jgi:uncharacterized protein YcgI (DUF1989 family)